MNGLEKLKQSRPVSIRQLRRLGIITPRGSLAFDSRFIAAVINKSVDILTNSPRITNKELARKAAGNVVFPKIDSLSYWGLQTLSDLLNLATQVKLR